MDDEPEPEEPRPPTREQLSKTPSWIMLGFAIGVVTVLVWPHQPEPRPVLTAAPASPVRVALERSLPPTLDRAKFFENVFAEWGQHAVWENELTEVAFWSADTKSFSDRYEVFRSGERFYFRSISQFTRPLLTHGVPDNSPLQFTEPQAARELWLKENAEERVRTFFAPSPAVRKDTGSTPSIPTGDGASADSRPNTPSTSERNPSGLLIIQGKLPPPALPRAPVATPAIPPPIVERPAIEVPRAEKK